MPHWLQRCPSCSFVAEDIACPDSIIRWTGRLGAQQIIASDAYRELLVDDAVPELARLFQCRALIAEANGEVDTAFKWVLAAAWDADDHGQTDLASSLRRRAANYLSGQEDIAAEPKLQLLDVLRRIGEWGRASELLERLFSVNLQSDERTILEVQSRLIQKQDVDCHTLPEQEEFFCHAEATPTFPAFERVIGLSSAECLAKYPTKRYPRAQEGQWDKPG